MAAPSGDGEKRCGAERRDTRFLHIALLRDAGIKSVCTNHAAVASFVHSPTQLVEIGAAYVLLSAFLARLLLRSIGVPSIVTLMACGLIAGPSGFGFFRLNLTEPSTRALLSLAVVVVLFEATLRMDLRHVPKRVLAALAIVGPAFVLLLLPPVERALGIRPVVAIMVAAVCVVTGPTVTGPLLARLRVRTGLSHLLETEGLALDALGVIVAAAIFTSLTSGHERGIDMVWHTASRVGLGLTIGIAIGYFGRRTVAFTARWPSDVSKAYILLLGFAAYATAEYAAHESGLTAVVACGLVIDFNALAHERLVRTFKEDLSMLALSTVFVLLASQIDVATMRGLVVPGCIVVAVLILMRVLTVLLSTMRSSYSWRERIFMMTVFPRGIVAVSLATYYATQFPAWTIPGGDRVAGLLFLVIVLTVVVSTVAAIVATRVFALQMPAVMIVGISSKSIEAARELTQSGHRVVLVDDEARRISFGRAHDLDAVYADTPARVTQLARERSAHSVVLGRAHRWARLRASALPPGVRAYALEGEERPGFTKLAPNAEGAFTVSEPR